VVGYHELPGLGGRTSGRTLKHRNGSNEGVQVKRLLVLVVIILACGVVLGFYRGWFNLSTDGSDRKTDVTITVDREKIHGDEERVKKSVHELGHTTTGKSDKDSAPPERLHDEP
jgi:hypothetical protein